MRCGQCGASVDEGDRLALLESYQPGYIIPLLRAERDLALARQDGHASALAAAITGLREYGTPYHLAHGLLDHAWYLLHAGDREAAARTIEEARAIGVRLGCQPLLARAEAIQAEGADRAQHQIRS